MSDAVARLAAVLSRRAGLHTDPSARGRLARCVNEAAAARGIEPERFAARCEHDQAALQDLLDLFTVQESAFFRDPVQFGVLDEEVLARGSGPVRVWSAGCGNGQEPWSLAMLLAESPCTDWRIVASDISERALVRARAGWYGPAELRGLSEQRRRRFGREVDGGWEVADELRDRVELVRHNVAVDPPPPVADGTNIVFCRNVLIYLEREQTVAFLHRLAEWLPPEGLLFLGYSESLWHMTDDFTLHRLGESFVYRPASWSPAGPPPSPSPPSPPAVPAGQEVAAALGAGEAAFTAGDYAAAVAAFTQAAAHDPDSTVAHLQLGLALEVTGETRRARRAFSAARSALRRSPVASVEAALEGYTAAALEELLDAKLG